jgi:jasmonate ZIM domain-containing protein
MERDFLGLSDKQYLSNNVKHEVNDDAVEERGLCSCLENLLF